jgi:hypothetical protein
LTISGSRSISLPFASSSRTVYLNVPRRLFAADLVLRAQLITDLLAFDHDSLRVEAVVHVGWQFPADHHGSPGSLDLDRVRLDGDRRPRQRDLSSDRLRLRTVPGEGGGTEK